MGERDKNIQEGERRMYDLKKKNQELEKFKFVLDFRIKELKEQVEPREQDIGRMRDGIEASFSVFQISKLSPDTAEYDRK